MNREDAKRWAALRRDDRIETICAVMCQALYEHGSFNPFRLSLPFPTVVLETNEALDAVLTMPFVKRRHGCLVEFEGSAHHRLQLKTRFTMKHGAPL